MGSRRVPEVSQEPPLARPRRARPRRYLMCPPAHFDVTYSLNAWTDPDKPVDAPLALAQWEQLREVYRSLGHAVEELAPQPGLPDMVFTANGATVADGRVFGARFAHPHREPEAGAHLEWFAENGFAHLHVPVHINEGEGDFAVTASWLLAGRGFGTNPLAHGEAQEFFGRPVISLELVDPRFHHLDLALTVLDDEADEVAYHPPAFSPGSREVLRRLFPDALLASEEDALAFGLNAVSDGLHVVFPQAATGLYAPLRERGFEPLAVDLGELHRAGGGAKCCTQELRP
ncbi:dimethylargininase [Streptomyces kebangsaanensis]|uniref:Dimethylargininase n=1 Tax=Streptomyces kebangsaanensis TaxID=864058 RepID=A0ABW6KJY0_9ACTN